MIKQTMKIFAIFILGITFLTACTSKDTSSVTSNSSDSSPETTSDTRLENYYNEGIEKLDGYSLKYNELYTFEAADGTIVTIGYDWKNANNGSLDEQTYFPEFDIPQFISDKQLSSIHFYTDKQVYIKIENTNQLTNIPMNQVYTYTSRVEDITLIHIIYEEENAFTLKVTAYPYPLETAVEKAFPITETPTDYDTIYLRSVTVTEREDGNIYVYPDFGCECVELYLAIPSESGWTYFVYVGGFSYETEKFWEEIDHVDLDHIFENVAPK